jgi:hypothetical protein
MNILVATDGIDGKTAIAVSGLVRFSKGQCTRQRLAGDRVGARGTTGTADVCAPSWMTRGTRDTDYLNAWLAQGYAVVASDYQGLGTPEAQRTISPRGIPGVGELSWSSSGSRRGRMPRCRPRGWPPRMPRS